MGVREAMKIDRKRVRCVFDEYVSNYNANDEKIKLKIYHTYRVAEISERIAKSLNFSSEDIDLAWLMGMLHDIGRFEQEKQYGTFDDSKSVDHAKFGVNILFNEGMIKQFVDDKECDELIRDAISYHNMFVIPQDITERTRTFSNILRDADKIDILKVHVVVPLDKIYPMTLNDLYTSQVTKEVMESYFRKETVLKSLRKTAVDTLVGHTALTFGLNYKKSFEIVKEQGCLDKLLSFESRNSNTQKQFAKLREFMNKFIAEKIAE